MDFCTGGSVIIDYGILAESDGLKAEFICFLTSMQLLPIHCRGSICEQMM